MRNLCYPLTPAAGGGIMVATLARVISAYAARPWYNHDCTQKPPRTSVQVTLAREAGRKYGAASGFPTNSKTRAVVGWPPSTTRAS